MATFHPPNENRDDVILIRDFDANFFFYSMDVNDNTTTNVWEVETKKKTLVQKYYPNPTVEKLFFEFNSLSPQEYHIQVFNSIGLGVALFQSEFKDGILSINIEKLSSGIYYALITSNGNQETIKFVKLDR